MRDQKWVKLMKHNWLVTNNTLLTVATVKSRVECTNMFYDIINILVTVMGLSIYFCYSDWGNLNQCGILNCHTIHEQLYYNQYVTLKLQPAPNY